MSTAVTTQQHHDTGAVEKVMLHGDLSSLSSEERISYYHQLCDHLGLNPVTQPFKILRLQGKDTLYATKDATEQLRKKNGVSVDRKEAERVGDVYVVTVYGSDASGRTDMATGAVTIGNMKGDQLANALMKAETKAKRRLTLSICGLGVLDETEIETIPDRGEQRNVTPQQHDEAPDSNAPPAQAALQEFEQLQKRARRMVDDAHLDKLISDQEREKAIAKYEQLNLDGLRKWMPVFEQTVEDRKAEQKLAEPEDDPELKQIWDNDGEKQGDDLF